MKHNKKRNTAFIYEVLARELTRAILDKNHQRKNKVVSIMKEYFSKGSLLWEELELYKVLLETTNLQDNLAERLLKETKAAHSRLDEKQLFASKSQLIATINKNLSQDAWNTFVPNFKSLASIKAIFNSKTPVKKKVLFEQAIIDTMRSQRALTESSSLKPLDRLAYGSFIKKFNDRYSNLIQEQKDLLNRYITSFADEGFELRLYLNEELSRLKECLGTFSSDDLEPMLSEKVANVVEYLEGFRKREFTENDLNKILKTQQLVEELANNDHL